MSQKTFTIEEFRNYVKSQDSLGDVLYNLNVDNVEKANGYESSTRGKIVEHKDLYEIFVEEGFDEDFKFRGSDGKIYLFDVDHFEYLITEYGQESVTDSITLVNGSIERMIEHEIAKLVKK